MPDVFSVLFRRWRLILFLTITGAAAAYIASLLSPKLYLGQATALPANTALSDKARIFNSNIEGLYSELGSPDDLDRIEGTAQLDTVFLAAAKATNLLRHYGLDSSLIDGLERAALRLRKSSNIARTGYGGLQIKVWDKDPAMVATLANALLQTLNDIHSRLQTENNRAVLQRLQEAYAEKRQQQKGFENQIVQFRTETGMITDSVAQSRAADFGDAALEQDNRLDEAKQYVRLISEYTLALKTSPKALLIVEQARPSPWYDRPKTLRNVLLAAATSLLFSFLLALFIESRNPRA